MLSLWLIASACCLVVNESRADFSGRVVSVHDGDTVLVARRGGQISVRLDEIDAPELAQPYGPQAQRSLAGLCLGRTAEIHEQGRDKYDRVLGRVRCGGIDANAEQLRRGYAWFYAQYARDMSLRDLEASARASRLGLWAATRPMPPWEFRHRDDPPSYRPRSYSAARAPSSSSGNCRKTCGQMTSCAEAMSYIRRCGGAKLDRDGDGVPCESLCK